MEDKKANKSGPWALGNFGKSDVVTLGNPSVLGQNKGKNGSNGLKLYLLLFKQSKIQQRIVCD